MTEMERRVAAVTATWEQFRGRPFAFGRVDCVRLVAAHLKRLGRSVQLAKGGSYRSALGAKRALARAGYASLVEALQGVGLVEIAPAAALPGDLIVAPGGQGFDALTIAAGNAMVVGFHDDMLEGGVQMIRIASLGSVRAFRA